MTPLAQSGLNDLVGAGSHFHYFAELPRRWITESQCCLVTESPRRGIAGVTPLHMIVFGFVEQRGWLVQAVVGFE
ncbi:MAG: hypothetical protein K8963_08640 [Proteobacteria bacterium]|nr:hypothetical protein [Pseudomonadota bacterium]